MNSSELSWCFKDLSCKITSFFFCAFWIRNASGSTVPLKFFAVKIYNLMVGLHFKSFFFQSKPNPLNLWRDLSGFSYFVLHLSSFSFWVPIVHLKIIVCCILLFDSTDFQSDNCIHHNHKHSSDHKIHQIPPHSNVWEVFVEWQQNAHQINF